METDFAFFSVLFCGRWVIGFVCSNPNLIQMCHFQLSFETLVINASEQLFELMSPKFWSFLFDSLLRCNSIMILNYAEKPPMLFFLIWFFCAPNSNATSLENIHFLQSKIQGFEESSLYLYYVLNTTWHWNMWIEVDWRFHNNKCNKIIIMLLITVHLQYVDAANNTKPTNANFFQKKIRWY